MKYENHLAAETSPYLLQHAQNPVEWYPWCDAAFQRAAEEDKPIFLSIGYSTCHWCHVMARESFENSRIADALKDGFIAIKVDREERPDVDNVYMRACQAVTGSGGWPMSIFMTPDKSPFFAGTYFPPDAFLQLVEAIDHQWHEDRKILLDAASEIKALMHDRFESPAGDPAAQNASEAEASDRTESRLLKRSLTYFRQTFDDVNGGFGRAPKFPTPHNLMLLLAHAPDMAEKTLLQMYKGGIFDHIGGGFSRYSTDARWLAPHFEKMLYDNALLSMAYTMAFAKTQNVFYRQAAERTLAYLRREMHSTEGGFYAAQDADTDGEEGKYYLFTPEEIEDILGKDAAADFCARYDISRSGNFEGKSIPNLLRSAKADAESAHMQDSIAKLYDYRKARASLHRDEKLLTGWNALAAAAFAFAGRIFDDRALASTAEHVLTFIEEKLVDNGTLYACYTGGKRSGPGYLDDHAFYILALIQMHKTVSGTAQNDGNSSVDSTARSSVYLHRAVSVAEKTISSFWDEANYGFFFSGKENETLITSVKECYDGAIPSGNSVMAYNLEQMIHLMEDPSRFRDTLEKHRLFMNGMADQHPAGHSFYLFSRFPLKEITCADGMCSPTDDDVF